MKRLLLIVLALALLLTTAMALPPMTPDEIMERVRENNVSAAMLEDGHTIRMVQTAYNADGTVSGTTTFVGSHDAAYFSDGKSTGLYQDGDYISWNIDDELYRCIFLGSAYEDTLAVYTALPFRWESAEPVVGAEVSEKSITLTTQGEGTVTVYDVDPETFVIRTGDIYSGDTLLYHMELTADADIPRIPANIRSVLYAKERTVTVITDAGTEAEEKTSLTTGNTVVVLVAASSDMDSMTYADPDCNEPTYDTGEGNVTLYAHHIASPLDPDAVLQRVLTANSGEALTDIMTISTVYDESQTPTAVEYAWNGTGWHAVREQDGTLRYADEDGLNWEMSPDGVINTVPFADEAERETFMRADLLPEACIPADAYLESSSDGDIQMLLLTWTEGDDAFAGWYECDPETAVIRRVQLYRLTENGDYLLMRESSVAHGWTMPQDIADGCEKAAVIN